MDDTAAAEQLESYNKVHCLFGDLKVHTRDDLMSKAGESPEGLVKCLGYLRKKDYIQAEGFSNNKKYKITDLGILQLPPDIIQSPVTKEKKKKKSKSGPQAAGTVHFTGLVGKVYVDKKGAVILSRKKRAGKVYFALNKEMTAEELAEVTGLPISTIWAACKELLKMGCFSFEKRGQKRYYTHGITKVAQETSKPTPERKVVSLPVMSMSHEEPIIRQKPPLEQELDELLKKYNLMEVFLSVFTRVDESHRDLYQFKQSLEANVGEISE